MLAMGSCAVARPFLSLTFAARRCFLFMAFALLCGAALGVPDFNMLAASAFPHLADFLGRIDVGMAKADAVFFGDVTLLYNTNWRPGRQPTYRRRSAGKPVVQPADMGFSFDAREEVAVRQAEAEGGQVT